MKMTAFGASDNSAGRNQQQDNERYRRFAENAAPASRRILIAFVQLVRHGCFVARWCKLSAGLSNEPSAPNQSSRGDSLIPVPTTTTGWRPWLPSVTPSGLICEDFCVFHRSSRN